MKFTKTVPFLFLITIFFVRCGNEDTSKNLLFAPDDWRSEIIEFPLNFAKDINYTGQEHIRFAPGWADAKAEDYFSYVFLWNIDQNPNLSSTLLESQMEGYFAGLMNIVSQTDKEIPKTKAFFEKLNDSVFVGKVLTYDAFTTKKEVQLNIIVEQKTCSGHQKHLVLFNISPKSPEHPVWKKMKKVTVDVKCK